ncbi:hypothetical protein GURASL_10130 [Geotalea uraniireducens]|uniref:Uncharacterized protein n=1 Tax=Geotalea uraniireducens TaxID=351604 RepID=A0ABN6VVI5_9BACT|nr:hypothetical protein [Geotalea uraniireducens]BDV42090.1 hypothetical protein GURASL_10130 [Geotalea uraniireducens]
MKRSALAISSIALLLGSASAALAASGAREDNSGIFVWIFLGFCALIVVAQLMPAVFMVLGFAKGLKKESPHESVTH